MKPPLSRIPMIGITAGFIAGIVLADWWGWIVAPIAICVAILIALLRHTAWATMAISTALGAVAIMVSAPSPLPSTLAGEELVWSAEVRGVSETDGAQRLDCIIDSVGSKPALLEPCPSNIHASVSYISLRLPVEPGARIHFKATLYSTDSSLVDLPDERDVNDYLRRRGFVATGVVSPDNMLSQTEGHGWGNFFNSLRNSVLHQLYSINLDNSTHEFLAAILMGDDSVLTSSSREELSGAGIAHVVALSGLHVAILIIVLQILLYPLTYFRKHSARTVCIIALLWVFALVTGMSASVLRAVIMATIVLLGRLLQRESRTLNSLCVAAMVILVFAPRQLFAVGFQLSFVAVAAIVLIADHLNPFNRRRRVLHALMSYVGASVGAMMSTGLIAMYYFHSFPVYFLLANVVASLLLPGIIGVAIVTMIVSLIIPVPDLLCAILDFLCSLVEGVAAAVTSLPGSSIDNIYISSTVLVVALVATAMIIVWIRTHRPVYLVMSLLTVIAAIAIASIESRDFPQSEYFLTRDSYRSLIVVRDGDSLYVVADVPSWQSSDLLADAEARFHDYRARRGLSHFSLAPDSVSGRWMKRYGNDLYIGDDHLVMVRSNDFMATRSPSHLLVMRGFTGDIKELCDSLAPDSVIICSDIHVRRAKRYLRECREMGVAARVMRKR